MCWCPESACYHTHHIAIDKKARAAGNYARRGRKAAGNFDQVAYAPPHAHLDLADFCFGKLRVSRKAEHVSKAIAQQQGRLRQDHGAGAPQLKFTACEHACAQGVGSLRNRQIDVHQAIQGLRIYRRRYHAHPSLYLCAARRG